MAHLSSMLKPFTMPLMNNTGLLIKTIEQVTQTTQMTMIDWLAGTYIVEVIDIKTGNGYMQRVIKQ